MKRKDCMTLGEFRELTKDMPDDTALLVVSEREHNKALALRPYLFCTSLDEQGVYLLEADISESVKFTDC